MSTEKTEILKRCHFYERLKSLLEGKTRKTFLASSGVSPHLWDSWMRSVTPSVREFRSFCETTRINPVWLALGIGERSDSFIFSDIPLSDRIIKLQGDKTVSEFARMLKLPRTTVNSYLKGINGTKLDALIIIAANTGCSFSWLLTGQAPKSPFEGLPEPKMDAAPLPQKASSTAPAPAPDDSDATRIADFRTRLDVALEHGDAHTLAWLRVELDVLSNRLDERWPDLARRVSSVKNGVA